MSEIVKYLGDALRRTYGTVVERPMPWPMIDKLASLEEREERDGGSAPDVAPDPNELRSGDSEGEKKT